MLIQIERPKTTIPLLGKNRSKISPVTTCNTTSVRFFIVIRLRGDQNFVRVTESSQ